MFIFSIVPLIFTVAFIPTVQHRLAFDWCKRAESVTDKCLCKEAGPVVFDYSDSA